jgi:hypothetical protein
LFNHARSPIARNPITAVVRSRLGPIPGNKPMSWRDRNAASVPVCICISPTGRIARFATLHTNLFPATAVADHISICSNISQSIRLGSIEAIINNFIGFPICNNCALLFTNRWTICYLTKDRRWVTK